ncbi:undecaprenyldiphospho-muramoylpentapeptide beta-N-acetylglucosaminyltransferase [Anaerococcus lactolyticus]|uniref:undecaprenyldiphospho-muramoylpentapeptide beta-N-acetylglucosaminyltransferase n=1 Tax=Anaerococcus lactolyticus TaxID=33032 RepID=UPI00288A0806|nr:undecaprenyldiphospho-muramoylpentapeptide beta-N-acetylglucosaminyltransferase [Anaerococcus lactolyticus]
MRVILSGGGTGGHIYPAIAIGQKIREENPDAEIIYVGIKGGPEEKIATKNGYVFKAIDAMGLPRKINKKLFKAIVKNIKGFREAKSIIKEFKPDLVIGTGGYVCAPILYQASKAKIPSIVHESNSYPGMASKFLSGKVDKVLISYKEAAKHFKNQANIVVTGNPVRNNFSLSYTDDDLNKLGIDKNIPVVFSFGGSNGSFALNKAVIEMSKDLNGEFYLLHQTGSRYFDDFLDKCHASKYIKAFKYIDNIDLFYAVSDLVIASSGAMSLAEISSVGKPSILIPKAYTTENHQEYNARTYVDHGASQMILEKDLTGAYLKTQIMSIIKDEEKIKSMGEKACELADNNALDKIYQQIEELI